MPFWTVEDGGPYKGEIKLPYEKLAFARPFHFNFVSGIWYRIL